jgi:hypothetical protein
LPALLVEALNEPMAVIIDGERREITKCEAVATQLVNKSTGADLCATKMLIDALKDVEKNHSCSDIARHQSRPLAHSQKMTRPAKRGYNDIEA